MSDPKNVPVPPTDAAEPELWRPLAYDSKGSPKYIHELPKPEGDPWQNILNPLLKRDKERCDGWKDEVNNLLIFAGLFSAVVTSFLIESYQTLQPDPQETALSVLIMHIATRLDAFNQTQPLSSPPLLALANPPFAPSPSSIRVNILWFISLILSLTVVLVGIVCLQWLREHQAYAGASSAPRDIFALFRMRQVALERWRVPMFFAALPLFLEMSLVLFFVGVADFLWGIQRTVAACVIGAISIPLAFLFLTTTLPTLQFFTLYNPWCQINTFVPAPCPYKSPQSRILLQVITWLDTTFQTLSWLFTALYLLLFKGPLLFVARGTSRRCTHPASFIYWLFTQCIRLACPLFFLFDSDPPSDKECWRLSEHLPETVLECVRSESWTKSDQCFLRYRAVFDRTIFLEDAYTGFSYDEIPYDVVRGLHSIVLQERDESVLLSIYNNFQEVSLMVRKSYFNFGPVYYYFGKLLTRKGEQAVTRLEEYKKEEILLRGAGHEWVMCSLFIHSKSYAVVPSSTIPKIQQHATELNIRLVNHLFTFMTEFGNDLTYRDIIDRHLTGYTAIIPRSRWWTAEGSHMLLQRALQFRFLFSQISSFDSSQELANDFDYSLFRQIGGFATVNLCFESAGAPHCLSLLALLGDISDGLTIPADDCTGTSATGENIKKDFFFWASSIFLGALVKGNQVLAKSHPVLILLRSQPVFDNWLKYHNYIVKGWDHNWRRDRPRLAEAYNKFTEKLMSFITDESEASETQEQRPMGMVGVSRLNTTSAVVPGQDGD